ncbi:MAG: SDR family NAD(P)-dependent oxidoreductase [Sphingomicrobium sp.]
MSEAGFEGRVALITGAGGGLGEAYAHWLGQRGCTVVVNDICAPSDLRPGAEAVAREIVRAGGVALADGHDVANPAGALTMVEETLARFGRLDIVIGNAAIQRYVPFADLEIDAFRRSVNVNLMGVVHVLHAAWPHLLVQRYGRIVVAGSSAGLYGARHSADYAATKAAMIGLARGLALEVPDACDILVNIIVPMARTALSMSMIAETMAERLSVSQVAPAVGWLCSDRCGETGVILSVGGGFARKVRFLEGNRVTIADGNFVAAAAEMTGLSDQAEPTSSFDAGRWMLMPLPQS